MAERALASGNPAEAGKLAQEALQANEDPARAYFVLAKVASFNGDMQGAQTDFQKALDAAKDPRVTAWCHIYLGRILDLQGERDSAVAQYKAALNIERRAGRGQDRGRTRAEGALPTSDRQINRVDKFSSTGKTGASPFRKDNP